MAPKEEIMEPYILFALMTIQAPSRPDREVTWTAEFSSEPSCEAAGSALGRKFITTPRMQQRFVAVVNYVCIKK
jgi:hypothetical protein